MARKSRKRARGRSAPPGGSRDAGSTGSETSSLERGYARRREGDAAARAALRPLAPGERPTAVTVGAVAASVLAAANLVAVAFGWDGGTDADGAQALAGSLLVTGVLAIVAYGMWRAR